MTDTRWLLLSWGGLLLLILWAFVRVVCPRWSIEKIILVCQPFLKKYVQLIAVAACALAFVIWALYDGTQQGHPLDQWKVFSEKYSFIGVILMAAVGVLLFWLEQYDPRVWLRTTQKERIRILEGFSPDDPKTVELFNSRSIYEAAITSLQRLDEQLGKREPRHKPNHTACLLLCSPAFDYPGNPRSGMIWGEEFWKLFEGIASHPNAAVDICYLPVDQQFGFNPMKDFLTILAHSSSEEGQWKTLYGLLDEQTKVIHARIAEESRKYPNRIRVQTHMYDIPFQMVLTNGKGCKEVVVSFAGREILESGARDIKGFFSSDPYVVETFQKIYNIYTSRHSRLSYVPELTEKVLSEHCAISDHRLLDYLNLGINIDVARGSFSPGIGNSTKFTAWAVSKVLTPAQQDVLDIGSGTGILALVAENILKTLGGVPNIVAAEPNENAYACLAQNCSGHSISPKRWKLGEANGDACLISVPDDTPVPDTEIGEFDVIIADLPFVDVDSTLACDGRFFDHHHREHATLLRAVAKKKWLREKGVLITAFSSLGGIDDVSQFESMIACNGLQVIQRMDFHESNLLWMVFLIMRKNDFQMEDYWWQTLNARNGLVNHTGR